MNPRDTRTGGVLESSVLPALDKGKYKHDEQVNIGNRITGKRHIVDVVAEDAAGNHYLISLKWQQSSGTAEQKVPFEIICLIDAVKSSDGKYKKAYLVLGGTGWTLRDFYTGDDLRKYLNYANLVSVVTFEEFIALANRGAL